MSKRLNRWWKFAKEVGSHIEGYTVPQYGDYPDDQMTNATVADMAHDIRRYSNRAETNMRGREEELRDCLKMAHYACEIYLKRLEQYSAEDTEGDNG